MSDRIVDDAYNKLRNDIGTDFRRKEGKITELYSFRCGNCGYHNIHNVKELDCGCGNKIQGLLVYSKIGDTVVYDMRARSKRKR
jgi:hypothetical protein